MATKRPKVGHKPSLMVWLGSRSLRERIGLSLALLVFVMAAILGGLVGHSSEIQARSRIGQSLAVDAQRLAERLTSELATRSRELNLIGRMEGLRTLASVVAMVPGSETSPQLALVQSRTQDLLNDLKASYPPYIWIGVAAQNGLVLAATDPASVGTTISPRGANRDGLRGPVPSRLTPLPEDQRTLDLVQPIRDFDGSVIGLIAAQLPWSWVRDIERATISADEDGIIRRETFLIGAQDNVAMGPADTPPGPLVLATAAKARAGVVGWEVENWPSSQRGGVSTPYLIGSAYAVADTTNATSNFAFGSQGLRWSVLVREAEAVAFAPATELRQTIWLIGLLIAVVFAAVGWLLAGFVTSPLVRIAEAAERLRQGDDVEIPRIRGAAEIDSLSASLRALVSTLMRKQAALDEMEELALRDPLTGLFNRHGLRVNLDLILTATRQANGHLLLFVGDLDGFKKVNDTLGHATGDQLLCLVGQRLKQTLRRDDVVARIGGDEFVLALPAPAGPTDAAALAIARRAQAAITAPYQIGGGVVTVGCSLGGACWPDHVPELGRKLSQSEEIDQILALADEVLYGVKRSGKGRMDVLNPPQMQMNLLTDQHTTRDSVAGAG